MDDRPDAVVVPGLGEPHGGLDRRDADDPIGRRVDEHEDVTRVGPFRTALERCQGALDTLGQPIAIGGQRGEAGARALR